ncbi:hypothetical protein TNCV_3020411 [Trichonephila clavipes]|nr:hypothetical protein TNCV_3020411 [Trichonephila clavipes]
MDEQSVTVIPLQMAMSIMVLLQLRWNRVGSGGAFSENPVQSQNLLMMFPGVFCWYAIKLLNSSSLDLIPLAFQEITVRLDLFMLQGLKVNFVSWQLLNGPEAFVLYWDGMCYFDEILEQVEGLSHCRGVELFKSVTGRLGGGVGSWGCGLGRLFGGAGVNCWRDVAFLVPYSQKLNWVA